MGEPSSARDVIPINIKTGQSSCLQAYHKSHTFTDYLGNNALTLSVLLKLFKRLVMPDRLTPLSFTDARNYLMDSLASVGFLRNHEKLYILLV